MVVGRLALMCMMVMWGGWSATLTAQVPNGLASATFEVSVVHVSKPDVQSSNLNIGQDRLTAQT